MKLSKLDIAAIAITAAALAAMVFTSPSFQREPGAAAVTVTARSAPSTEPSVGPVNPSPSRDPKGDEECAAFPININTATAEELQSLPGIGEARAKAIVDYRAEHGPFTYVEDLRAVSGIGEGILADLMDYITVGERDYG